MGIVIAAILCFQNLSFGQNNRQNIYGNIGWTGFNTTTKIAKKFSIHGEYQWRRYDYFSNWQQSQIKIGLNYHLNPRVIFRLGYGWIETYAYGDIPVNSLGRKFLEHRAFEMIQLSHKEGIVDISHRFILEQRFVGKFSSADVVHEDQFPETNRMRYMVRAQVPLKGREMKNKTPYFALFDELLIGFGKNVNANIFDQNRFGAVLGYRLNKLLRFEAGYFNQTLQFGRLVNGQNVFQHNNGVIINLYFIFDLTKHQ